MRSLYLAHREILQTASRESASRTAIKKVQTASGQFIGHEELATVAGRFPLPWSCYVRLLSVRNPEARRFYEAEALQVALLASTASISTPRTSRPTTMPPSTDAPDAHGGKRDVANPRKIIHVARQHEISPPRSRCYDDGVHQRGATDESQRLSHQLRQ